MSTLSLLLLVVLAAALGYALGNRHAIYSYAHVRALEDAMESYVASVDEQFAWLAYQLHHFNAMQQVIQQMKENSLLYEVGKIDHDEAVLQFEMLRAEGQVHFDELDEQLRDWHTAEIESLGGVSIFRNGDE